MQQRKLPDCYTESSIRLLESRFLKLDKNGKVSEDPYDLFMRVADWVSRADSNYTKNKKTILETQKDFFENLYNLRFIPNSPTLLNAGKKNKTLSACFVLPIEDSLDAIYQTLSDAVQIQWKGGGTGFNFTNIRPKGDAAGGIPDVAAGPVHFIKTFSAALMGIRQSGKRGGANIAILNVNHPDILEFIHLKEKDRTIMNFNISVGITDKFMEALRNDAKYDLINPRTGKKVKSLSARYVFNELSNLAHKSGDPGIAFIDNIEKDNPTPHIGTIDSTNPCGEQPLLPYESCNLGALNLRVHFDFTKSDLDWNKLKNTIRSAVHFLDNIIDINYYPLKKIEKMTRYTSRKIGLGLMGFADVLILKEIPYNSQKGIIYARKVMKFIQKEAIKASSELAGLRGTFPAYKGSLWEKKKLPVRNATITTIAPNGNTSIIGGSTGGIEPAYALAYKIAGVEDKNYRATNVLFNVNKSFEYIAKKYDFFSDELIEKLSNNEKVADLAEIPDKAKSFLVTSHEIEPMWHLKMQAAFQKYTDNAISKTINFPNNTSISDIKKVYIEAYKSHLKGVTIFRDGCKESQTYVSTDKAKLNITENAKKPINILIASEDNKKVEEITEYIKSHNGNFHIVKDNFRLPKNKKLSTIESEKELLDQARKNAEHIASKTNRFVMSEVTGFISSKMIKNIGNINFYGKDGKYHKSLFEKLVKYDKRKGLPAYISSAIATYDPLSKSSIMTATKIPGKIIKTSVRGKNFYYFIHKGISSFDHLPNKIKFSSFNHTYNALKKIFDKLLTYKKDIIDIKLTPNAYQVLEKRALRKDKNGKVIETPVQLFMRIAEFISKAGKKYGDSANKIENRKHDFFKILKNLEFQCGGALIWAGMSDKRGRKAILSKCFVLPVKDSIKDIFDTLNENIEILRHGGGTGFNFTPIRSSYAKVSSTNEHAAGPVEYLKVFNRAQDTIIGRGGRQMGSMAILNVDHPNISEFMKAKTDSDSLTHYNISVGISNEFMDAVNRNASWELVDPQDKKVYKKVKAQKLFDLISKCSWETGDPGVIFLDHLEKDNPTPHLGAINATNVCGEQPLLPYESCNLGNINLSKIVKGFPYLQDAVFSKKSLSSKIRYIDWDRFEEIIDLSVEFLDNVIDVNNYPIPNIEKMTKKTRSIGLGIIGFADLLIKLGIPYSSEEAVILAKKIMKFLNEKSHKASQRLGKVRGNFPEYKGSIWEKKKFQYMRNSRCTTIAPTGTLSIVVNSNPGIEPIFALVFKRQNSLGGTDQIVIENLFEKIAKSRGFYSNDLLKQLSEGKKLSDIPSVPKDICKILQTSHEIDPLQHVKIQAAFQQYCDSGVSKTINLQNSATIDDIKSIFKLAYKLKCKGITIFRDGCKSSAQTSSIKDKSKTDETRSLKLNQGPRQRPATTRGVTTQVKTDQGSLFLTINEDDEGIAEVFLNIGKSGGYSSGYCEAIGRLISVSLRSGLPVEAIIDQLKGIRTSTPTLNKGMFVYSVPDAVAKVLENYQKEKEGRISMFHETKKIEINKQDSIQNDQTYQNLSNNKIEETDSKPAEDTHEYSDKNKLDMLPECPDCGGDLQYAEGCMICQSCGFSKCG